MILLENLYLYRVELSAGARHWLVRSSRPAAPNPDGAACELASIIAYAKAETLLRSALAEAGEADARFELRLCTSAYSGEELRTLHGTPQLSLWIAIDGDPADEVFAHLLITGSADAAIEAEIDAYLELELFDFRTQRCPARHYEVRLITAADYDLLDCRAFVTHDVMWLERAEGRRWLDEGPDAWIDARPPTPARTQAELDAATLAMLEGYLQELRGHRALRALAFEISELIPLAPAAGVALIEELADAREELADDWKDACWAIAHALVTQIEHIEIDALRERWSVEPNYVDILKQLDELLVEYAAFDDEDDD